MTTTTVPDTTANQERPTGGSQTRTAGDAVRTTARARPDSHPQTLVRAISSEWIKIRTLRSTWVGMAAVVLVMVGLAAIAGWVSTGSSSEGQEFGEGGPLRTALTGADFAVLLVGVLGALAGAREYASRMISTTVVAVPRRWQVVVAKAAAMSAVVALTALVAVFGAFAVGMITLSANDAATVAITDDGVLTQLFGMAGYLTAIAVLGLGLGIVLRGVAASIGVLIGGIMLLPVIAGALLPAGWDGLLQYLPSSAAAAFTTVQAAGGSVLDQGAGVLVLAGWVLAALAAAVVTITRRDV